MKSSFLWWGMVYSVGKGKEHTAMVDKRTRTAGEEDDGSDKSGDKRRKIDEQSESSEEEYTSEEGTSEDESDADVDIASTQKREFNNEEINELSHQYRSLNKSLEDQRTQLITEDGVKLIYDNLSKIDELFKGTQHSSNTEVLAKDAFTLNEIGEQAKIATMNVKFGVSKKSIKLDDFADCWKSTFGSIGQINVASNEETPPYNWAKSGLLFNCFSNHINGCDFLLGPLEIERKRPITRTRLVDDSKKRTNEMKTANAKQASEFLNKDKSDDTAKAAQNLFMKLKTLNTRISLFECVLHPTSFGKSIESIFVVSFLINNGLVLLDLYSNRIPYLEIASPEVQQKHQRFIENDDSKSHIVFNLDEETWKELVEVYQIKEPFFTMDEL